MDLPILIVGSSGHAKVVIDIVERAGQYRIVGLLDCFRRVGEETMGYPVLGSKTDLPALRERFGLAGVIVAIGDNAARARVSAQLAALCDGLVFVNAIHPSACVAREVSIGAGSVVAAGAVIGPGSRLGVGCLINTRASLDHDGVLGDHVSLAPGATLGGGCRVGDGSAIGLGASVIHEVRIGAQVVVGAGSTVLHALGDGVVAYGTPARPVRSRVAGDPYL